MENAQKQSSALKPSRICIAAIYAISILSVAVTLVSAGLLACAGPKATTAMLSNAFSTEEISPFTQDELVEAAVATRTYTVGDNDRDELFQVLGTINREAALDGRAGHGAPQLENVPYADGTFDGPALENALSHAGEEYTLPADALSHLDDVHEVIGNVKINLIATAVLAGVCVLLVALKLNRKILANILQASAILVIAAFAALALWVAIDFNGFFAAFHSLFFAAGTWTFDYDSLLITMYPTEFWIGMGAIWLAVTVAGCLICLIIGHLLRKHA